MAYTTETLSDQPVIITTYHGHIAADELLASQQKIMEIIQERGLQQIYAIQDVQQATTSFADVVTNIKAFNIARKNAEAIDQTLTVLVFVGSNIFLNLITGLLGKKQYGDYRVVSFRQMDDARQFIDLELAQQVE